VRALTLDITKLAGGPGDTEHHLAFLHRRRVDGEPRRKAVGMQLPPSTSWSGTLGPG
jgi:hypothetical protein